MFLIKIIISAIFIAIVTEIAKLTPSLGGLIAAMPLTTFLSLCWLYYEKRDTVLLADFTTSVFWGIFPTLLFFLPAIFLFKKGYNFYVVLLISFIFLFIGACIHQMLIKPS